MPTTSRRITAVILASSLAGVLAACSAVTTPDTSGTPSTPSTLTIALPVEVTSFDVQDQNNGYIEGVYNNVFNYLVKRDDSGEILPDLAESWERVTDDTWRFTLRSDLAFQNGEPLTADDVKFSLERVATTDTLLLHSTFAQIQEVRVIDDTNLEIVTAGPDPVLLNRLSRMGASILPEEYIGEVGMEEFSQNPVGSGPYRFVSMTSGDRVVLEKYPDYFEGDVSDWDEVVFRYVAEASTRVNELQTGGVDLAADISPSDWASLESGEHTTLLAADSTTVMSLMVRSDTGPTADVRVRQAIDYAIDNRAIAETLFDGRAVPTRTRVTPGITGSDESLFDTDLHDPDRARELLSEAGYADGVDLTLQTTRGRNPLDGDVAQLVASMLTDVGIRAHVEIMETSQFSAAYNSGTGKDIMLNGSSNSMFDASQALRVYRTGDGPSIGYSNAEVDALLDSADVNLDPEARTDEYIAVQQIVAEEVPIVPLYLQQYFTGARSDRVEFDPPLSRAFQAREIHAVG